MKGILAEGIAVLIGGIIGAFLGQYLPKKLTNYLFQIFGICAISMGVVSLVRLNNLFVVILSVILGAAIGWCLRIEEHLSNGIEAIVNLSAKKETNTNHVYLLCTAMMIACFSGTGIYGAIIAGLDNDISILMTKAILDFFTIMVLATKAGMLTSLLVAPQFVVLILCYLAASLFTCDVATTTMDNFRAVGGILTILIGYNMIQGEQDDKKISALDALPALLIVFVVSYFI